MSRNSSIMTGIILTMLTAACAGGPTDRRNGDQPAAIKSEQLHLEMSDRQPGDVNLDGRFDTSDLVILNQSAKYETGEPASWEEGDFDGDGYFTSADIVLLMQAGCRYESTCQVQPDDGGEYAPGDANRDGFYNSADITLLYVGAKYETGAEAAWHEGDFNGDGVFDSSDLVLSLQFGCAYEGEACIPEDEGIDPPADVAEMPSHDDMAAGDTNGDGVFNSSDLVNLLQSAKYETGKSATWEEGDWNGDGVFDSSDIVLWQQSGAPMAD